VIGEQLPLSVALRPAVSFDDFHPGPNRQAIALLRTLAGDTPAPGGVFLYGATGSGRTHLLQALARETHSRGRRSAYLPMAGFAASGPQALDGFGMMDLLCLDDVDAVLAMPGWALALLRLLDTLRARGAAIALTASTPPERASVALPDLATRLSACAVAGLKPLQDEDRLQMLATVARSRGLDLSREAARRLLAELPRDAGSLLATIDALDEASLRAQRRLTLSFVNQWLRQQRAARPPAPDARERAGAPSAPG
jgi:DnaA family protein